MIIRLLLALIFTALAVVGSSAIVYRGWQINHPTAPVPDVKALLQSPELVKTLTVDDLVDSLVAVVTGQPQKQPIVVAKTPGTSTLPVLAPAVVNKAPSAPVLAPAPAVAKSAPAELKTSTAWTPLEKGCALGGLVGGSAALVIGPGEIAAFATGAVLPVTIRLVGTVIGAALVAGCTAGAVAVPIFDK